MWIIKVDLMWNLWKVRNRPGNSKGSRFGWFCAKSKDFIWNSGIQSFKSDPDPCYTWKNLLAPIPSSTTSNFCPISLYFHSSASIFIIIYHNMKIVLAEAEQFMKKYCYRKNKTELFKAIVAKAFCFVFS